MNLITTRDLIRHVAERWKAQYSYDGRNWEKTLTGDTRVIYERLLALDPETATHEQVAAIIGNAGWSRATCNECGQDVEAVVEIGQPPAYNTSTAQVCAPCMQKAVALFGPALRR